MVSIRKPEKYSSEDNLQTVWYSNVGVVFVMHDYNFVSVTVALTT